MAVRISAAALVSPVWHLYVFTAACVFLFCWGQYVYSRQELIHRGAQLSLAVTADFQRDPNIPVDTARPPGLLWIVVGSVKRWKQCGEKEADGLAYSQSTTLSPFLSSARSTGNKIEEVEHRPIWNLSMMALTGTLSPRSSHCGPDASHVQTLLSTKGVDSCDCYRCLRPFQMLMLAQR